MFFYAGFSSVSHTIIKSIITEIQEAGFITLHNIMLQCGPVHTNPQGRKSISNFLLRHFPILRYHVKQSKVTYFVDGLNPPDDAAFRAFFNSHVQEKNPACNPNTNTSPNDSTLNVALFSSSSSPNHCPFNIT